MVMVQEEGEMVGGEEGGRGKGGRDLIVVDDDKGDDVEADDWVAMSPDVEEIVGGAEDGEIETLADDDDDVFAEDGEVLNPCNTPTSMRIISQYLSSIAIKTKPLLCLDYSFPSPLGFSQPHTLPTGLPRGSFMMLTMRLWSMHPSGRDCAATKGAKVSY